MSSKAFLVLGLLVASIVLLISSKVAARDLAETSNNEEKNSEVAGETNGVDDAKHIEYGGYPGGLVYGGYPGGGGYGGYPGGGGYGGYPGGGGYGGYPGGGGYGGYPGGGGYGGGYCRYGCCGRGYYGRGCRCCSYAGQVVNAQTEAKPHN